MTAVTEMQKIEFAIEQHGFQDRNGNPETIKDFTQEQIAGFLGVNVNTYRNWSQGRQQAKNVVEAINEHYKRALDNFRHKMCRAIEKNAGLLNALCRQNDLGWGFHELIFDHPIVGDIEFLVEVKFHHASDVRGIYRECTCIPYPDAFCSRKDMFDLIEHLDTFVHPLSGAKDGMFTLKLLLRHHGIYGVDVEMINIWLNNHKPDSEVLSVLIYLKQLYLLERKKPYIYSGYVAIGEDDKEHWAVDAVTAIKNANSPKRLGHDVNDGIFWKPQMEWVDLA